MKRIGMGILVVLTLVALCVASVQGAQISVEPSYMSVEQGDTFTVNITVDPEGTGVLGAEYKLFYDNILFNVLNQNKGQFLSQDGAITIDLVNDITTPGKIEYGEMRKKTDDQGVTAFGTLATIEFEVIRNSGNSELRLAEIILSDSNAAEIQNVAVNSGYVGIAQPSIPFLINGYVFYENNNECNNPTVNITNLDTGGEWTAETIESSNYYQIMLTSADIVAGETLQFNVVSLDGSQMNVTEYAVTQDEINDGGLFNNNITLVVLNAAPVADPSGPYTGTEGTEVAFDGSASYDLDGTIDSYDWDFGDGNSGTGVSSGHTYVQDGTYTVTLTVTDNDGAMDSDSTTATISDTGPVAEFTATPLSGSEPLTVVFTDTSTSYDGITSYEWDFNDDGTVDSTVQNPTYIYTGDGAYTVTLKVFETDGNSDTETKSDYITVSNVNQLPVADPSGPYTGTEGTEVAFDGSASSDLDGSIVSYDWDFGDGNSGTGVSPNHTYVQDGTYTVTLTVTDNDGAMDSDSTIVVVGNIAPTVIIHSPASITNDSTPLLHATFDQLAAPWYVIDGAAGTGGYNTDNLTVTLPQLADGQHAVKVYANNSNGNVGSATQDFLVDTIGPAVTIDQVTTSTNVSSRTISGTFTESGSGIDSITVNGVEATILNSNYSATINLTEGTNQVDVIAIDNVGNSGSNSTTIVLDTTAPVVTIDQVTTPTNVSSQIISGTFMESGSGIDSITVNGVEATISNSNYSATINLTEGTNPVNVIAIDNAGNSGSNSTIIVLDTTAPTVSITKPKQNKIKFVNNIVRGKVDDNNLNYARLIVKDTNGTTVSSYNLNIKANKFTQRVQFAPNQSNTIELFAIDNAGNFNNASKTIFVETNMKRKMIHIVKNKPVKIDGIDKTGTAIEFLSNIDATNVTFILTAITNQTQVGSLNNSAAVDGEIAVGKIVEINVFGLNGTNESQVQYVIVKLHYTKDDLDLDGDGTIEHNELDENNMFIYWLNTSGNWTKLLKGNPDWVLDNGQVKISGNDSGYVWVKVKHLSTFGLVASPKPEFTDGGTDQVIRHDSGSNVNVRNGLSGEAHDNIALKEFIRKYIGMDTRITYQFEENVNSIEYITFDAKTTAGYVVATIEVLDGISTLVSTTPSGLNYQHMNILVGRGGYATENNIANPVIGFKVAKSWITENGIDKSTIRLNRYIDEKWNSLATSLVNEDADYLHFESVTSGFSSFAITAEEMKVETGGEGIVVEPAVGVESTEEIPEPTSQVPGFGLLSGLSIMLISMQILRKNK